MGFIRKLLQKISAAMTRFMVGRYGMDQLSRTVLWVSMIAALAALLLPLPLLRLGIVSASYLGRFWVIFRTFSSNTYKRYRENRRYLMLLGRVKDKDHRYYTCPRCRQPVRVPRGKGKIAITCPKCKEKFVKKT